jgi:hypothetical protein
MQGSAKREGFTLKDYQSPSHTKWDCRCHVVFTPERQKQQIFGTLRQLLASTVGLDEDVVRRYT